jgi:hypothetical protein
MVFTAAIYVSVSAFLVLGAVICFMRAMWLLNQTENTSVNTSVNQLGDRELHPNSHFNHDQPTIPTNQMSRAEIIAMLERQFQSSP